MSNLTQFAPFASGGLKSFQTGFSAGNLVYIGGGGEDWCVKDITVSAVVVAKTITAFQGLANNDANGVITTRMTTTTNLRVGTPLNYGYTVGGPGRWQAAEAN
jgi:hypothetical protein